MADEQEAGTGGKLARAQNEITESESVPQRSKEPLTCDSMVLKSYTLVRSGPAARRPSEGI